MSGDDDWGARTMVGMVSVDAGWRIYRVTTKSSSYTVGLRTGGRKVGSLQGLTSDGRAVDVRDTEPMVGGELAFNVPPEQWVGKQLDFAGVKTSAVVRVGVETDVERITALTSPGAVALQRKQEGGRTVDRVQPRAERTEQRREPTPYPLNLLEYVESAHQLLSYVVRDRGGLELLAKDAKNAARVKIALAGAVAMAEAAADRLPK